MLVAVMPLPSGLSANDVLVSFEWFGKGDSLGPVRFWAGGSALPRSGCSAFLEEIWKQSGPLKFTHGLYIPILRVWLPCPLSPLI